MIIAVSSFYVHAIKKNNKLILEMDVVFYFVFFNGSLSIADAFLMWCSVNIFDGIKAEAYSHFGISQLSLVDLTTSTMKVQTKESHFGVCSLHIFELRAIWYTANLLESRFQSSQWFCSWARSDRKLCVVRFAGIRVRSGVCSLCFSWLLRRWRWQRWLATRYIYSASVVQKFYSLDYLFRVNFRQVFNFKLENAYILKMTWKNHPQISYRLSKNVHLFFIFYVYENHLID